MTNLKELRSKYAEELVALNEKDYKFAIWMMTMINEYPDDGYEELLSQFFIEKLDGFKEK